MIDILSSIFGACRVILLIGAILAFIVLFFNDLKSATPSTKHYIHEEQWAFVYPDRHHALASVSMRIASPYPIKRLEAIRNQWPSSDGNHPEEVLKASTYAWLSV